ncbi:MAG TPA: LLM class flavin-dependent oxidoreductase [Ktedonobacteraceae bacterium]|nr:LLM class flavin-dependent oxidoreductase [Ktedonobacteraceae bacterium]
MKIGIGLPATIPGTEGTRILEWAKKADSGPFSSLGILDRLVFPNYETLTTLAAVAGVTQRIRLTTTVLLAPLRNPVILAKQAASLDALSGGRLTLGLGIGAREDDYLAASVPFKKRGKLFEEELATLHNIWSGQPLSEKMGSIGPKPAQSGGPEILIGGYSPAAIRRVAHWGNGFIAGGRDPKGTQQFFRLAEETWKIAGRPGEPRLVGCFYYALGPDAKERASVYLRSYYSMLGPMVETMIDNLPMTFDAIKARVQAYEDIGADEVIMWPCTNDLEQLDQLTELFR